MGAERVCGKTPILSWMLGFFLTGNKIRKKEGDQEKTRQGRAIGIYHLAPPSSPMLSEPPEDGCVSRACSAVILPGNLWCSGGHLTFNPAPYW